MAQIALENKGKTWIILKLQLSEKAGLTDKKAWLAFP